MVYSSPRRSSFPSPPLRIHPHHSFTHTFSTPSHAVLSTLTVFPALSWTFLPLSLSSNYFITHSVHLFSTTHSFQCPHFCHIQLPLLRFLRCTFMCMWYFIETNQEATVESPRNSRMTRDAISSRNLNCSML